MGEEKKGFFRRLVSGLTKTRDNIVSGMDSIFHGFSRIDDDFYEELEETLIMGDLGVRATMDIIEDLKEKVKEVPNVEKLLAIKGVGMSTVIGFIAEVGDIGRFTDPKQIQKLAGLEIVKKSSGKKKGQPRISKRGRRKLRRTMYESARALMTWNPAFQDVFLYYRNRTKKPLGGMQAKIAVACKAIRIFYVVLKTGCDFDEEKFRKDIIRPEAA